MKRLLCIVGSMNAGGAETFLMKVYRQLDKSKYQMDFAVAVEEEGFYDKEILDMGGKIHHITPKSMGVLKNFNSIKKLVRDEKYEYVLRTSQHSLSALELLAAKYGGAKVRVFRSSNSNTTSGSRKAMMLHKICGFMPKYFANVRIAPSTEAAEFMFGKGCIQSGRARLIHNGVDTAVFCYNSKARDRVREEFGIKKEEFVIGHVGRFNQQKNHQYLIEVFFNILKRNSYSKLILVGMGELEDKIRKQVHELGIEKNVIFAGVRKDIPDILSACDTFVFPSFYEGMPNTVIEAQAVGLPCIISDRITREADITGLVNYLKLDDIDEWTDMTLRFKDFEVDRYTKDKFVINKYDINVVVKEFESLIFGDINEESGK